MGIPYLQYCSVRGLCAQHAQSSIYPTRMHKGYKAIGLSVCRCCHCCRRSCWHENRQILRCRHLSKWSNCQMRQKTGLTLLQIDNTGPRALQIVHFHWPHLSTTLINAMCWFHYACSISKQVVIKSLLVYCTVLLHTQGTKPYCYYNRMACGVCALQSSCFGYEYTITVRRTYGRYLFTNFPPILPIL